jgi:hypothetical protein
VDEVVVPAQEGIEGSPVATLRGRQQAAIVVLADDRWRLRKPEVRTGQGKLMFPSVPR